MTFADLIRLTRQGRGYPLGVGPCPRRHSRRAAACEIFLCFSHPRGNIPVTYSDPKSAADIDHRFDFHPATTAEKRAEHGSVRAACKELAHKFDRDLPPGREKALAVTKLEEAMFWANAAIARAGAE
jgi:hypothetical protein